MEEAGAQEAGNDEHFVRKVLRAWNRATAIRTSQTDWHGRRQSDSPQKTYEIKETDAGGKKRGDSVTAMGLAKKFRRRKEKKKRELSRRDLLRLVERKKKGGREVHRLVRKRSREDQSIKKACGRVKKVGRLRGASCSGTYESAKHQTAVGVRCQQVVCWFWERDLLGAAVFWEWERSRSKDGRSAEGGRDHGLWRGITGERGACWATNRRKNREPKKT